MKNHAAKHHPTIPTGHHNRFLHLLTIGAIFTLLATPAWLPEAKSAEKSEVLLLSCMDFRLIDDMEHYMSNRGLRDKYDHIILAGASLGATTDKYPAWNKAFWDHLEISINLHNIQSVILMDHRDCGGYKLLLGDDHLKSPEAEMATHAKHLQILKNLIKQKYPQLNIETVLMNLDGSVETIE